MKRRWPLGVAVLALVLGVVAWWSRAPGASPVTPSAPPGAEAHTSPAAALRVHGAPLPSATLVPTPAKPCVRGRVVHAVTGQAVAGAQVVWATARGAVTAHADAQGRFELEVDEGGVGLAEVTAEGFFPVQPPWGVFPLSFVVHAGTCASDVVLSLVPRVTYAGWVVGPDDEPVEGASVTIATAEEPPGPPLRTDREGHFTFSARDGAVVVARHPAFSAGSAEVDFRVGVTGELVVRLGRRAVDAGAETATLTGVVVDERDAGLPGAQVKALRRVGPDGFERLEGVTECGDEGRFSLTVEGPAPWTVVAHVPGVVSDSQVTHGEPVVLRVVAGASLTGRVTDDAGKPVTGFSLLVSHEAGPLEADREEVRHVVAADGRFELTGLAPGPTRVVAAALGYAPSLPARVELSPGAPRQVDFRLSRGARVAGQVLDRDTRQPLEGARISLESQGDETLSVTPSSRTGPDGRFELSGLAAGPRSLFVVAAGHHARLVSVALRDGEAAGPVVVDLGAVEDGGTPQLELVGIGAVLKAEGDALVVLQVVPGGGAAEVGLAPGDGILSIDGEAASSLGFAGGVERIRGPEGTTVTLEVRRADATVATLSVPRRRVTK